MPIRGRPRLSNGHPTVAAGRGRRRSDDDQASSGQTMSEDTIQFDASIDTERELTDAFGVLLQAAKENGLDPIGTWDIRNGNRNPDWEVMVLELVSDAD